LVRGEFFCSQFERFTNNPDVGAASKNKQFGGYHMKKWRNVILAVLAVGLLALSACGKQSSASTENKVVKLGINGSDDGVWKAVGKRLAKEGITLKLVTFSDYNQPNTALADHDIDLNAFQHQFFLDNWNKTHHTDIVSIGKTLIAPMAVYSQKITKLSQIKDGDTVAIPNDTTNEGRALQVLESAGLIKVDPKKALPTPLDVTSNPKHLKLKALDAAQTASSLPDVTFSVINSGVAQEAKLDPKKAIFTEKINADSKKWINIIAANAKDKNNATYKKVVKAYQTDATKALIKKLYGKSEIPAWD